MGYGDDENTKYKNTFSKIDFKMDPLVDFTASGASTLRKKTPKDNPNPENPPWTDQQKKHFKNKQTFNETFGNPSKGRIGTKDGKKVIVDDVSGSNPIEQWKAATKGRKIKRDRIKSEMPDASRKEKRENMPWTRASKKKRKKMNSPAKYLNPNTLEVQGDAGQTTEQTSRAGRPVNSNVLMNDPVNYQDPSKISAQQNNQEQLFSGLASSAGMINDPNQQTNMIPNPQPDQSITPDIPSPFSQTGHGSGGAKKSNKCRY